MKILIIGDNVATYSLKTDTTYFMLLNLFDMGLSEIYMCFASQLSQDRDGVKLSTRKIILKHGVAQMYSTMDWYEFADEQTMELCSFTDIFVRNDPPVDMEYIYLTHMLSSLPASVKVHNPAIALREFNEKLNILKFPAFIAETIVAKSKQSILDFVDKHGKCVIKPLDLMGGRGIFILDKTDLNLPYIVQMATNDYTKTVMIQKFIPEIVAGDKRIFIVNGELIPYSLCRIPKKGSFKGNIASGASGEVMPLTVRDTDIGRAISLWAVDNQINFIGFDVIGSYLTEVNLTSPTGTHPIYNETGINITRLWLDKVLIKG